MWIGASLVCFYTQQASVVGSASLSSQIIRAADEVENTAVTFIALEIQYR